MASASHTISESLLLSLPDPCLSAVLRCCDPRSLFSAGSTHSRLHREAVRSLSSISVGFSEHHQTSVQSLQSYLSKHGQHVSSIALEACDGRDTITLCQLPHSQLHGLSSLSFRGLDLQLRQRGEFEGVLMPGGPLKQLQLEGCNLLDGQQGLKALALLPELQHLSFVGVMTSRVFTAGFPANAMHALQQLTYLEVKGCGWQGVDGLRPLTGLTRLQHLTLHPGAPLRFQASTLSGLQQLTLLETEQLHEDYEVVVEPAVLASLTRLQHLGLRGCGIPGDAAGVVELCAQLEQLQLSHLDVTQSLTTPLGGPQASAYSALTASSMLQHLDISGCMLPTDVWQHLFPVGRQLPCLHKLNLSYVRHPTGPAPVGPQGSRLVSCCPGLQSLQLWHVNCTSELLAPLSRLSGLTSLKLWPASRTPVGLSEGLAVLPDLTGLRELQLSVNPANYPVSDAGFVLQLTQLQQLTALTAVSQLWGQYWTEVCLVAENPDDRPVWNQLLRRHLIYSDMAAQHAAAASDAGPAHDAESESE